MEALKTCNICGVAKVLDEFPRDNRNVKDGRKTYCKPCQNARRPKRECPGCGLLKRTDTGYHKGQSECKVCSAARWKGRKERLCRGCRLTCTRDELKDGKCAGCRTISTLPPVPSPQPARPGCIIYKGVCLVLELEAESWRIAPVKVCKQCGVDQHLEVCLDCTDPVGAGDKQKSIRPLRPCPDCRAWSPGGQKCYGCRV